jgi:uncharacterized caspase-like protein
MNSSLQNLKRKTLKERLELLEKQYTAVSQQLLTELNAANRVTLEVQLEALEKDIVKIESELASVQASPATKGTGEEQINKLVFGTGNRWAVLVGVNHYDDFNNYGNLKQAVSDVTAIQQQLLGSGYETGRLRLLNDDEKELPTRNNILTAFQSTANATEQDDLLLFYYSGHGDLTAQQSYLVARDGYAVSLADTAVSLKRIEEIMREAKARAKIIILDACHSGANIGSKGPKKMSEEFIKQVFAQAEGMAVLSSCKQGELSYEWAEKEQGVFTHYLLEALTGKADLDEKGFVTVQDVNRHLTNAVKPWSTQRNVSQTPTLQYTVSGDIILADLRK